MSLSRKGQQEENIRRVVLLYRDHEPREIAHILGLAVGTVYQYGLKGKVKRQFYKLDYLQTAQLLGKRARDRITLHELGREFGISTASVAIKCKKYGLTKKLLNVNLEDRIWSAVIKSEDFTEFRELYEYEYSTAKRFKMLEEIKEKFVH